MGANPADTGAPDRGSPSLPLDTLAQLGQSPAAADGEKLIRRARAKYISVPLAVALAELRSPLEKSYRNTVYCAGTLEQDESGRLRGTYCGNRWCLVCNRVRIARAITRYLPVLAAWRQPHLVTLTLPNVRASDLSGAIDGMIRDIVAIGRAIKRTDRLPLRALRKLECTYNVERNDYHPHFHIAVEGEHQAQALRRRWLSLHPKALPVAQDVRPCDSSALRELFKYFTKILTKRPGDTGSRAVAPAVALDVIFSAMRGRRVFQPMGFTVAQANDENAEIGVVGETIATKRPGESVFWDWIQEMHDWIDLLTGEVLTGYEPTEGFQQLVEGMSNGESAPTPAYFKSMRTEGSRSEV